MTAVVLQTVDSILYRHMGVAVRRAAPQRALFGAVVFGIMFVAHGFTVLFFALRSDSGTLLLELGVQAAHYLCALLP